MRPRDHACPECGRFTNHHPECSVKDTMNLVLGPEGSNPKDAYGDKKPPLGLVPIPLEMAKVMALGARKYGAYNWRAKAVRNVVYIHACLRHITAWMRGENSDPESGASHLAHAAACLLIVLDAGEVGKVIEERSWLAPAVPNLKEQATAREELEREAVKSSSLEPIVSVEQLRAMVDEKRLND